MKANLKNGQEIIYKAEGNDIFSTDKRMLKNILLNLLSNALKFSGESKQVFMETINRDGQLILRVKDNGLGIPDDDQPYLFTTFFRATNANNIQGTGLGLPIVKRYVNLLGGDIEMQSKLGKGTEFIVLLPALPVPR
jgi:signal transduction histidine kinase